MAARQTVDAMYAALPRAYRDALQAVPSPGIDINMTQRLAHGGARSRLFGFARLFRNVHLVGSTSGIVRCAGAAPLRGQGVLPLALHPESAQQLDAQQTVPRLPLGNVWLS